MSHTIRFPKVARLAAGLADSVLRVRRLVPLMTTALMVFALACSDASDPITSPRPVASVSVSPEENGISVGQTLALAVTLKDAAGSVLTGRQVRWSTSSAAIATVSATGVVTAVAEGTAMISAESEGKVGQSRITVAPVPVARVGVTPAPVVLDVGSTRQLTAVAFDANENVIEGRTVQWVSDAPAVATVSATGVVRAIAHGYATISAKVDGVSGSVAVTVPEPEPAASYDLVYEQRTYNGLGTNNRIALSTGTITSLPVVVTIPGTYVRDVTPSPDGSRLAFTLAWYPEGSPVMDSDIYVATIDGRHVQRLTTTPEPDEQPSWSPDGTRITFRSKRSGNWDIWTMGANGTGQVNLTADFLPATSTEATPAWSPDGSRIVYSSDIDSYAYPKLWTMRADGSDKRRVLPATAGAFEWQLEPSWSPDGARIAFRRIGDAALDADIVIATLATGTVRRIALSSAQTNPAWSPDGSRIAFSSSHDGLLAHIYTMAPDGTDIRKHTSGVDQNTYPRWLRSQP